MQSGDQSGDEASSDSNSSCFDLDDGSFEVEPGSSSSPHTVEAETLSPLDWLKHQTLKKTMCNLNLAPSHTSASGRKNMEDIVELASLVRLYGDNYSNFCESIEKEMNRRDELDREVALRKRQVEIINKKLNSIHKKFEVLKNYVPPEASCREQIEVTDKKREFEYLALKCNKYSTQIAHLRRRLDISTKTPSHPQLAERADHLAQVRKQISAMKNELETYIEFPADINLAKVKLEQAKRQLELLDKKMTLKIDLSKS